jgi:CubicO group peptidase (beta-lactamase class C family)
MRGRRELIAVLVILCLALVLSIPSLIQDMKTYQRPKVSGNDGWETALPQSQGMDSKLLGGAAEYMEQVDAMSLVVVRHGKIVLEKYYNGFHVNSRNNVYSVTKSVVSALVGIAVEKQLIPDVEQKAIGYFPEYAKDLEDSRKNDITVRHLLTMTPGFCEDLNQWTASKDWLGYAFQLPLKYKPGETFQYANSATHLLSGILTKVTKQSTLEFAKLQLFEPLGITGEQWGTDPMDFNTGYANLYLRARDMARFGLLYLHRGEWEGKQLVPVQWVEDSIKMQVSFSKKEDPDQSGYGYKWWVTTGYGPFVYAAKGYGGQNICIIPELDTIVVTTAIPDSVMSFTDEHLKKLLMEYVIPSVEGD